MEGKLIKVDNEYKLFQISEPDGTLISVSGELSIKNCNAIANGYDLEELACDKIGIDISVVKHIDRKVIEKNESPTTPIHEAGALGAGLYHMVKGFEIGFQKALEILGDKKFSLEDMKKVYLNSSKYEWFGDCIKSLQQTEWDVEIEMEKCGYCEGCNKAGMLHCAHADSCGYPIETERPKLDTNGCLILKKI